MLKVARSTRGVEGQLAKLKSEGKALTVDEEALKGNEKVLKYNEKALKGNEEAVMGDKRRYRANEGVLR